MCRSLMGCVLIVVNIVVMVLSLAFAAIGGIMLWSKPLLRKIMDRLMESLSSKFSELDQETVNNAIEEIMKLSHPIGAALFGIGIVLFVFAILAFVGVCCNLSIFLIIYAILLGVLIIAHTIFLIIYFLKKDVVLGYVRRLLEKQTLLYKSLESKDPDSVLLGALMTTLHCCGYNNGSDFYKEGAQFTHRDSYDGREFINISYPLPCCNSKESKKLLASYIQGGGKPVTSVPLMCPYVFTEENSHYNIGCRETVEKELVKICDFAAYVSIGPLLLEVILFILAVAIVILRKKE